MKKYVLLVCLTLVGGSAWSQEASSPLDPEKVAANRTLVYGEGAATLTCAPGHYCALAFQQGERISSVQEPDQNWSVSATTYGAGIYATPVIILSPRAVGAANNLTVTTDRHVYHVALLSSKTEWVPTTAYFYPQP